MAAIVRGSARTRVSNGLWFGRWYRDVSRWLDDASAHKPNHRRYHDEVNNRADLRAPPGLTVDLNPPGESGDSMLIETMLPHRYSNRYRTQVSQF